MTRVLFSLLAVGLIALAIVYISPWLRQPNVNRLVDTAMTGATHREQVKAAQSLAQLDERGLQGMRQLIDRSDNEEVVAISISGAARMMDYQSMEPILDKLIDDSLAVRAAAAKAASKLLGRNHHFPIRGTVAERADVRQKMVEDWNQYNGSELFEFNKNRFQSK